MRIIDIDIIPEDKEPYVEEDIEYDEEFYDDEEELSCYR